jgi:glucokinase
MSIDLGGTNVRLALVSPQGKILSRWERATAAMPDQAALVAALAADLTRAGAAARESGWEIKAGGIGVPGRVLPREGRVVFSPNVAALNDCRLVEHLSLGLNWPLFLENDANLFALGEHWLGAGVGHENMLGITLGTGVGGGLILNGRLWSGAEGTSGEIGHMTVDPEGRKCHCGNRGCLETMASAFWTVTWVKEQLAQGASSWLKELYAADPEAIRGETLVVAALQGDPLARRAFDRVGRSLGQAIAAVVHLLGLTRVEGVYDPPSGYDPELQGDWDGSIMTFVFTRRIRKVAEIRTEKELELEYQVENQGTFRVVIREDGVSIEKTSSYFGEA